MSNDWKFREAVNTEHVFDFLRCVADIIDTLDDLRDADQDTGRLNAISSAGHISIPIRKLLLDGNGHLFKSCFEHPTLHPLKRTSPATRPITFVQKFNRPPMELGFADGRRTKLEIPEYEQRTVVHPLYGIRHDNGQTFVLKMPFDTDAHPLKFKAWVNTKALQVDDMIFTAKDLLREVVNNEGAHIGDSKKLAMPDGSTLRFDNMENKRYKAVSAVKFGGLSYAQNFVISAGLYIVNRSKTLIGNLPFDEGNRVVAAICRKIDNSPTEVSGRVEMENQTYHGLVLDRDLKLRPESIGVYSTLMKIP